MAACNAPRVPSRRAVSRPGCVARLMAVLAGCIAAGVVHQRGPRGGGGCCCWPNHPVIFQGADVTGRDVIIGRVIVIAAPEQGRQTTDIVAAKLQTLQQRI